MQNYLAIIIRQWMLKLKMLTIVRIEQITLLFSKVSHRVRNQVSEFFTLFHLHTFQFDIRNVETFTCIYIGTKNSSFIGSLCTLFCRSLNFNTIPSKKNRTQSYQVIWWQSMLWSGLLCLLVALAQFLFSFFSLPFV